MREIKFRIRNTVNGRTDFVSLTQLLTMDNSNISPKMVNDDFQISQYTGLKDKDGVEIYEGDIIHYVNKTNIETTTKEVKFIDGCFVVQENDMWDMQVAGICSNENHKGSHVGFVIGNIYANPELLNSSDQ